MRRMSRFCLVYSLLAILAVSSLLFAQYASTVKIPDGTPVRLSLLDSLSSATNRADEPVHFEVTEDVKAGNVVAIPKGATATGHIVEAEPKRRLGRAGKLNFSVDYVKAPDGNNVRLRASSTRMGQDKSGTVIVGTVLVAPLFLLMRGKDVEIPKGTQFNAYVDGDREVALTPGAPAPVAAPAGTNPLAARPAAPQPAARPTPPGDISGEDLTTVVLKSTPVGAEISIDGRYVGSTPSTVRLAPGDHSILIEKSGHRSWQRTMSVNPGGIVTIDAALTKLE